MKSCPSYGFLLVLLTLAASAQVSAAQVSPEVKDTADRLAGSVYTGPSMTTLRELSDGFGGRLSGSPAYNRAAEWAAARFRSYGIQNVRLEPFTMPSGWQRGTAHGEMLAPTARPLHVESLGWAPSTPAGGVKGEVILIDDVSADSIKSKADKLKGKIVILDTEKIFAEGWVKVLAAVMAAPRNLKDVGAVAMIFPDSAKNNVINATSLDWGGSMSALPGAELGMEDSALIRRLMDEGSVSIQFELSNKTSGQMQVNDVVAEIRGRELPDEWILIGAHLDSWDFGTGAEDNGTGSASVLEVARAVAALGKAPRRSIRFALWGGEEEGLLGSYAYVQAHLNEIGKCVAVLNTDNGSGHPKGWKVEGRKDLKEAMQPISDSLLKDIGGGGLSMEVTYDTDHGPFMLQGVPALDLWVDMKPYVELHHKSSDTYDKVDPVDFKAGSAIVVATAWVIAEDPKPIAGHIDHAAVAEIIKKDGLDQLLKEVGQWKP
ncbi:MAG: M20/M25/M40 family metallo-hydrolase [Acidobacteriia bacterium]|nr:M20/M25/M40 family metallo-hydrolase [Terriglobia bacterium]